MASATRGGPPGAAALRPAPRGRFARLTLRPRSVPTVPDVWVEGLAQDAAGSCTSEIDKPEGVCQGSGRS